LYSFNYLFIFFVCPKKTNQKKGQPITRRITAVPLAAEYPALLKKNGRLGKSLRSAESLSRSFLRCSAAWKGDKKNQKLNL